MRIRIRTELPTHHQPRGRGRIRAAGHGVHCRRRQRGGAGTDHGRGGLRLYAASQAGGVLLHREWRRQPSRDGARRRALHAAQRQLRFQRRADSPGGHLLGAARGVVAGKGARMTGGGNVFSDSYVQARTRFLQSAREAGLEVESKPHPLKGRDGEELALDVARDGHPNAASVLIVSSACHGVEGFCGSGVQLSALSNAPWREHARRRGVAVLYLHALNPYGFSHLRRTTHENVDLNRNFHDFSRPLPVNEAYREIHALLLPEEWPPSAANNAAVAQRLATSGEAAYQAILTRGQYEFPGGLFFGGTGPTWSNLALREVLRSHGRRAARIAWIDIH